MSRPDSALAHQVVSLAFTNPGGAGRFGEVETGVQDAPDAARLPVDSKHDLPTFSCERSSPALLGTGALDAP